MDAQDAIHTETPSLEPKNKFPFKIIALVAGVILVLVAVVYATNSYITRQNTQAITKQDAQALTEVKNSFNKNDFTSSIQKVDAILSTDQSNTDALVLKATILAQEGSIEFKEVEYGQQAIVLANQALSIDPKNGSAWRIIGYANEIMQKYPEAHDAYSKAITLNPKDAFAISQNAHAYDLQGDLVKAEEGYRAALAIDPSLDLAQMGLGRILTRQGKLQEALDMFTSIMGTSENVRTKAEAAFSAGSIAFDLNKHSESKDLTSKATVFDPTYALGWYGIGKELFYESMATSTSISMEERKNLFATSYEDILKAIQINPNQSIAHYQLGVELSVMGQKDQGLQILTKTKGVVPNDITLSTIEKQNLLTLIDSTINAISVKP